MSNALEMSGWLNAFKYRTTAIAAERESLNLWVMHLCMDTVGESENASGNKDKLFMIKFAASFAGDARRLDSTIEINNKLSNEVI